MSTLSIKPDTRNIDLPAIRRVETGHVLLWLKHGWKDLLRTWPASLGIGALFVVLGYLLMEYARSRPHLALTLASGFLLVSPFLAIAFYELSRHHETSRAFRFDGVRRNAISIGMYALMLAFILSSWERISAIMVGLFFKGDLIADGPFALAALFAPENFGFVIPYLLAGGALAALVFALSVVSLPMLMDRKVDFVTAIVTSLWVVRENPPAMLVWAFVIGVLTLLGELLWFAPLAVIFPLLGHATWHAYRDLVTRH
jgi:Predicted integral membrane protein